MKALATAMSSQGGIKIARMTLRQQRTKVPELGTPEVRRCNLRRFRGLPILSSTLCVRGTSTLRFTKNLPMKQQRDQ